LNYEIGAPTVKQCAAQDLSTSYCHQIVCGKILPTEKLKNKVIIGRAKSGPPRI
jgi:hypothetical protein